ncbi:sugar phosphate isomerase/epimerase family protein [Lapidilactobacillus luobeiensis]|uniref:sugar phosphate isomerase/epimerase family protein n=1 Tax=Lapidilactobacillus luobeiensis TaxID=2950371 RepID=UPI0021C33FBB|nr:sugar phosphate isomerase/epimerase family protein [Lapidilactobacillus luobeiensis]
MTQLPLNLGIRAHDLSFSDPTGLITDLKNQGFQHTQFSIKKCFPTMLNRNLDSTVGLADHWGNLFQKNDLKISVLGCYVNLASEDPAVRANALAEFKHDIQLVHNYQAALIGTETGSVANGYTSRNFTEQAYQTVRSSVAELIATAENFGVTVAIEAGLNHPIYTSSLAKRLIHEIQSPNLKIILDCANLARPDNYQDMEAVVGQALTDVGDQVEAIHLKDFIVESGKIKVVPVGQGLMDFTSILTFIKYERPGIYVSLEATRAPYIQPAIQLLNNLYEQI